MRLSVLFATIFCAGSASADVPRVAVDIAPLHSLVAQVMEGVGAPDLVIRPGATPHHYALRPSEAAALSDADLVIWMGEGLTPWLAGPLDKLAGNARHVALLQADETHLLPLREEVEFEHDEEGHGADDHGDAGHDEHGHDHHGGVDPHAWLSLENAAHWVVLIADELAALDAENAATYQANAARAATALEALQQDLAETLRPVQNTPFMVFHDAYQYFEHDFDMPAAAAVSLSDASRPGPARIAALRELAAERQIACVLTEPQFDPKLARSVMGEGYETHEIDPMGAAIAPGPALYPALMRALADGFASCAR